MLLNMRSTTTSLVLVLLAISAHYSAAAVCSETKTLDCHQHAYCENEVCSCPEGLIGDGEAKCDTEGWTVRTLYTGCAAPDSSDLNALQGDADSLVIDFDAATSTLEVNQLYVKTAKPTAPTAVSITSSGSSCSPWEYGSKVYSWVAETSGAPIKVMPTGLTVDSVAFNPVCSASKDTSLAAGSGAGCWVIGVTYSTGGDEAISTIYFPNVISTDAGSYDEAGTATEQGSFLPTNFPVAQPNGRTSSLPTFATNYNLLTDAKSWANGFTRANACNNGWAGGCAPPNNCYGWAGGCNNVVVTSMSHYLEGVYPGLINSPGIVNTTILDPFFFQYSAVIEIEETDMRSKAGIRKGTVGVEYTVDSFVGFANFKPTPELTLDTMVTQTAIHLEKTNFFSVSTHGTNDYTFLEYVNLRLVSVLLQDDNNSDQTTAETGDKEIFTDGTNSAVYVQVTFTLGSQYRPNENEGLIPLTSVRTGKGTFMSQVDDGTMAHSCAQWAKGAAAPQDFTTSGSYAGGFSTYSAFSSQDTFESRLAQTCAPGAAMCEGPLVAADLPDQFVSFNIPLGIDYLGVDQSDAAGDLSTNVFVDMVISAVDKDAVDAGGTAPNAGGVAQQMKTTLTASIPVVDGGVNLFCDGVMAKTDLKDVAKAHLVIGSAMNNDELSRLTIFMDIANTAMSPEDPSVIDTDSIEASLMTLVIEGDDDYFNSNSGTSGYSLELEDVITVHIMDPSAAGTTFTNVKNLLATAGDDNQDATSLDTDGYALNGAFDFTIDRVHNRAHLEPSTALLLLCPFNPTRPLLGGTTCVTRRDVRYRDFPARTGGVSTAMEITPSGAADYEEEARFMQTVLGGSDEAANLGRAYAGVISTKYLAGDGADRYNRAWWINPGYEWTPSQTNGKSIFNLSQQIIMFALINLNENYVDGGSSIPGDSLTLPAGAGNTFARRRMLLSTVNKDQGTTAMALEFDVSPSALMASALNVPEDRIGLFEVHVSLTQAEACMDIESLSGSLAKTFDDYLTNTASLYEEVFVVSIQKDMGQEDCKRRRRLMAFSSATATVQMLIAFTEGTDSTFNIEAFAELPGIEEVTPNGDVSKITLDNTFVTSQKEKNQLKKALDSPEEEGGDNSTVIIAAACGGVGALLLVGVAFFFYKRSSSPEPVMVETVATSVHDLKAQLANDV